VFFYLAASKFGAWAPQEVGYSEAVNTGFPWISGVAIGLLASMNEEFTFRLFAIPFFARFSKSRWIAIIVPAFLWGFLHSNYPQEPAYIRGIEVGLIGIVAGLVMLRWGILATLIWHYTVDASLVGLFLIRSDNLYFKISGVVVGLAAVAPLLVSAVSYLRRSQFEDVDDLKNIAGSPGIPEKMEQEAAVVRPLPVAVEALEEIAVTKTTEESLAQPPAAAIGYKALSGRVIAALAVCVVIGAFAALKLKPERIGNYLRLTVNAQQAALLSDDALRNRGVDLKGFHHTTLFLNNSDPGATEFLREKIGASGVNKLYAEQIPIGLWGTRYFKDSDPEEYFIALRPNGQLHSIHHTIAENAAGASLTKEEAVAVAEKYLKSEKNLDLAGWSLVDSDSKKRPHRIDHTLTWQQNKPLDSGSDAASHAYARTEVKVTGDEAGWYRTYVKIPEEWERKREEEGLSQTLFLVGKIVLWLALGATMFVIYFQHFRSEDAQSVPWRRLSKWAMWSLGGLILTIAFGDRLAQVMQQYQTAMPLKAWYLFAAISLVIGTAFTVGALILTFGIAWFYCRRAFGESRLPRWTGMQQLYYRDALLIGIGGVCALAGLQSMIAWARDHFPTVHRFAVINLNGEFAAMWPAASAFGASLSRGLFISALVAAVGGFFASYLKPWAIRIPLLLLGAATLVGDWGNTADFLQRYAFSLVTLVVIVLSVSCVSRLNLLGTFLAVFCSALLAEAMSLLVQPNEAYRRSAYTLFAVIVVALGWPLVKWLTAASESRT
jgi:Type II CAAX prenyl endopeptidase Rce1-like